MWLSVRPGRDRDALERVVGLRLVDEHDAGRAHRELVAVGEEVVGDALAAHERAVERAQVAQQEAAVGGALDLRVLLRDDPIEDLDRVVGMAADRVEGGELELLPLLPGDDDQLGHRTLRTLDDGRSTFATGKAAPGTNSLSGHGKSVRIARMSHRGISPNSTTYAAPPRKRFRLLSSPRVYVISCAPTWLPVGTTRLWRNW